VGADRGLLIAAFEAAIESADPQDRVRDVIQRTADGISVGGVAFPPPDDVVVVGLGKAAPAMARGVADAVGGVRGLVVCDHLEEAPVDVVIGGHPIPTEGSIEAGRRLLDTVASTGDRDLVIFVISGGGSAIAEVPAPGISLDDVMAANRVLIGGGLPIEDINEIRASMSDLKGGRLLQATASPRAATLVLSDVVGAGEHHVASGPTLGHGLGSRAAEIIERFGIGDVLPAPVVSAATRPPLRSVAHPFTVVGSPALSAKAAAEVLTRELGSAHIVTTSLTGDVGRAVEAFMEAPAGSAAVVAAGETTVTVTGTGLGGRNQHAALLAALRIRGTGDLFGAFGTDGRDGPTNAAGAVVDGGSVGRMLDAGVDVEAALGDFNANRALSASGDVVITGPTGTNVADVWMAVRSSEQ
jgi:hydroxypyruvate reductase